MFSPEAEPCCSLKCNKVLPEDLVQEFRDAFHELTKYEQDLVMLAHFELVRERSELVNLYAERRRYRGTDEKKRLCITYTFHAVEICRCMYLFIHDVGRKRFENLRKH